MEAGTSWPKARPRRSRRSGPRTPGSFSGACSHRRGARCAREGGDAAAFLLLGALAGSAAGQTKAPAQAKKAAPASSPDFSGTWKLDEAASANVSPNMKAAVLVVEQKGDHIRVSPAAQGAGKVLLAGEEIIADGQPYEKSVGGGKGVLTARWSADRKSLELVLSGTEPEKKIEMVQTGRWSLGRPIDLAARNPDIRRRQGPRQPPRLPPPKTRPLPQEPPKKPSKK